MYKRILIVVDPRPSGRAAIEQGTELARTNGAAVVYFSPLPRYAVLIADAPPYIAVPAEPRLMKKADWSKGEKGVWKLYPEGADNDGDGQFNEDGPGGVNLGTAFPHLYRFHAADAALAAATALAASLGVPSIAVASDGDDDARSIIEAARERDCDLIVVASEGRNALVRLLTGSIIPGLITASTVPVLVCRSCAGASAGGRATDLPLASRAAPGGATAGTHVQ
jgi:nucleotide-binding universal stress UspA family protein